MKVPSVAPVALGLVLACSVVLPLGVQSQTTESRDVGDALPPGATRRIGSARFRGPSVETIACSPDGRTLAAGNNDGKVRLFDALTGRARMTLVHKSVAVAALSFSPDGRWLASGGEGTEQPAKELTVWDAVTGEVKFAAETNRGYSRLAFSADGKWLAAAASTGKVVVWHTGSWEEFVSFEPKIGWFHDFCFAPDSRTLVYSSRRGYQRRDLLTGKPSAIILQKPSDFNSLAVSPDAAQLAVGSADDNAVVLRDLANNNEVRRLLGHRAQVYSMAYSPDGALLATAEQGTADAIRLWDPRTGEERGSFSAPVVAGGVRCVRFAPDGRTLAAVCKPGGVVLWDVTSGQRVFAGDGHEAPIRALALSADGSTVVTGDECGTIHVRDRATGRLRETLLLPWGVQALATSADGRVIAGSVNYERYEDREYRTDRYTCVWDTTTGRELTRTEEADECLGLSPEGRSVITRVSNDIVERSTATGRELRRYPVRGVPSRCAVSRNGRWLAVSTDAANAVILIDRTAPAMARAIAGSGPGSLAFGADDRILLTARAGSAQLWDVASAQLVRTVQHAEIEWATKTPDGRYLATGKPDVETIRVWELATGRECLKLAGHTDGTRRAAFAPDGRTLISAGRDATVLYWDLFHPAFAAVRGRSLTPAERTTCWDRLGGNDAEAAHRASVALIADGVETVADLARRVQGSGQSVPPDEELRHLRAIGILERIGGAESKRVLKAVADGAPDSRRATEAAAALRRLG
jgi:WD40 repeat protein